MPRGGKREGAGRKPGALEPAKIELATLAKRSAQDALSVVVEIMNNQAETGSTRLSAAVAILDRGYGRPFQAIHHAGADGGELPSLDPLKLSAGTLRELLDAMDETPSTDERRQNSD